MTETVLTAAQLAEMERAQAHYLDSIALCEIIMIVGAYCLAGGIACFAAYHYWDIRDIANLGIFLGMAGLGGIEAGGIGRVLVDHNYLKKPPL
jgi:hypothetical protein